MADAPESTHRIDALRAKFEADPKSRHFYPLAEELRKLGQLQEAENVLRAGLVHHASYLSAWISLGRVLKERGAFEEAIDVLMRGLSLDPENVVAAKLIANVYLAMGNKVEAIKKFKLVHALMPSDEDAEAQIELLDREINPQKYPPASEPSPPASAREQGLDSTLPPFPEGDVPEGVDRSVPDDVLQSHDAARFDHTNPDPFALGTDVMRNAEVELPDPELTDEVTPFGNAEFPHEAPVATAENAVGDGLRRAPSSEDVWTAEEDSPVPIPDLAATVTMAEILVQQGQIDRARETYNRVLERDPMNAEARLGLQRLDAHVPDSKSTDRVARLEAWRRRVVGS